MRVLVVDAQMPALASLQQVLVHSGFEVDVARDAAQGCRMAQAGGYSLVVLELAWPWPHSRMLLKTLSASCSAPVIVVSVCDSPEAKLYCLRNGAEDYLVRPLHGPELVARARLRMRGRVAAPPQAVLALADLVLDLPRRRAERAGQRLDLTLQEFAVLLLLLQRQGDIVSRDAIFHEIWQRAEHASSNVVDVTISRLRTKLDGPFPQRLLHTVRRQGYVLERH
ncbi:MAG: response regulator transcription factor [Burkholderiaceae bacterium]|jgi:two-component system copper resistance phosphate regulon response regulator CusR|nr:response regulator transcription factor [Burkholderiaceae bacterium]